MTNREPFPVITITDEMILQDEPMGSKDKFWCQLPDGVLDGGRWLFKTPRQEAEKIEHLAEKVAQELGDMIEVPCACIELAEFRKIKGTISRSVLTDEEQALVHGNEIIAGRVVGYDLTRKRHSCDHTFERIQQAIMEVCKGRCDQDLQQFCGYLVLDALIVNTDRHHENWGLLRRDSMGNSEYSLAPSFDHASSLGREMRDRRRQAILETGQLDRYIQNGAGAIYLTASGNEPVSPLHLVRSLSESLHRYFQPWLKQLGRVTHAGIDEVFDRIPIEWITPVQRNFATALILRTRQLLTETQP